MESLLETGVFPRSDITRNGQGIITGIDTYISTDLEVWPTFTAFDFGAFKDSYPNAQVNSIKESRGNRGDSTNDDTSSRVILVDSAHISAGRSLPAHKELDEPLDIKVHLDSIPSGLEVTAVSMGSHVLHFASLSF